MSEMEEIKSQLEEAQRRCKYLEKTLSKQTMECYAEIDRQAVEIARLHYMLQIHEREDGKG